MKKSVLVFIAALLIVASGCGGYYRNEQNLKAGRAWIESKAGNPDVDISGDWEDTAFASWGNQEFAQSGNKVVGTMGSYNVEGVVNGKRIYLIAVYDGYLYYTIIMDSLSAKKLKGKYIKKLSVDENFRGELFYLKRISGEDDYAEGVNRVQ